MPVSFRGLQKGSGFGKKQGFGKKYARHEVERGRFFEKPSGPDLSMYQVKPLPLPKNQDVISYEKGNIQRFYRHNKMSDSFFL